MSGVVLRVAALSLVLVPLMTGATEFRVGDVLIEHAWSRPAPAVAVTGAAYFTLSIAGDGGDRLIAAASPVAERVEFHRHSMRDGVMSMRRVPGVDIVPRGHSVFEPGGLHVMLMGLREHLQEGTTFPLTLTFEKAGSVVIAVSVEQPAAPPAGHSKHRSD